MELVYLWVEDYKNIHKQGFNFSPRFNCKYDEDKNELTIDENDNYIENFFGENINVTAIVGKNGSGKSNLLGSLYNTLKDIYYLYYKDEKLYSNFFEKDLNGRDIVKKDIHVSLDAIYMNRLFFMQKYEGDTNLFIDSSYRENLYMKKFKSENPKNKELSPKNFHKKILKLIFQTTSVPFDFFNPEKISINTGLINKNINPLNLLNPNNLLKDSYSNKHFYKIYLKSLEILQEYKGRDLEESENEKIIEKLKEFMKQTDKEILEYEYSIDSEFDFEIFNLNEIKIFEFLEKISAIKHQRIKIGDFMKDYIGTNNYYFDVFYYLYHIGFLEYDFYDEEKSFSSLSSGEQSLFSDFCLLNENLKKENNDIIHKIIFLDEPDLTLHPEWQREYINIFILFLKKYKNIKFHLVLTTHSPFLLSDLPKGNIIFLKDGKQVDGLKEKKQTFGTNIHTLLSDSFFMEDGLMGEFAKGKIEEVINFLREVKDNVSTENKEESTNEIKTYQDAEKIISIIGEPILKMRLEKMLDKYKIKQGIETEEDIQKKIDELNQKLRKMQNGKDKPE